MGKIISLNEVKAILQISGSTSDLFLETMIPIAENFALSYCNISEDSGSVNPGIKLPLAQLINYQLNQPSNISSETIGAYSVAYIQTYPKYLIDGLRPFRKIKFIQDTSYGENYIDEIEEEFEDTSE